MDMRNPSYLKYSRSHEWMEFTGEHTAKVGLTDFAQKALGSIVFINLPEEGDGVETGVSFGEVESVKTVSDIISPVSGAVGAINEELLDTPEKINEDPYGSWLIEVTGISGQEELLDAPGYEAFCRAQEEE